MAKKFSISKKEDTISIVENIPVDVTKDNIAEEQKNNKYEVDVNISLNTIFTLLLVVGGIYFGSRLLSVFTIIFFAFIMSSAALPSIRWLMNKGVSKGLATTIVYMFGIALMLASISLVIVPSLTELQKLIIDLPRYINGLAGKIRSFEVAGFRVDSTNIDIILNGASAWLSSFSGATGDGFRTVLTALTNLFGGALSVVTSVLISVYIVSDHDNFVDLLLLRIYNERARRRVRELILEVEGKLGSWLVGQASLSLIIGVLSYILLKILNVPFALPLAVVAGLLETIPSLGPTISVIPAIIITLLTSDPWVSIVVVIGYLIIQQFENTLIVPKVMSSAVGLRPLIVIITVTVGFSLAGPLGALLSVPIAVMIQIAISFYTDLQKLRAKGIV